MLTALTVPQVEAIALAAKARADDVAAMTTYLYPKGRPFGQSFAELDKEVASGMYESPEKARLTALIEELSPAARSELIAVMWLGRGSEVDFGAALATAIRNVPSAAQVQYILGKPLQKYLPLGLSKLA